MTTQTETTRKEKAEVVSELDVSLKQIEDFEFSVRFGKDHHPEIVLDEPEPLGKDKGPSASRMLAAVGNCLSASLLFCSRKSRVNVENIETHVRVQIVRNERGRLRVGKVFVEIDPHVPPSEREKAQRCMDLFEDFCVVTQSVRQGIDIDVAVKGFEQS